LRHHFTPPSLETVVHPVRPADRGRLRVALDQLAEQDPLINVRQDDLRAELSVSLYGEVQKEVIEATLINDFGVPVRFAETSTICVERPLGVGSAVELMRGEGNPFLATIGLRVEPARVGSGVRFAVETAVHGTMPPAFFKAVEDTVLETAGQALHGWQLVDALITLTHTGYAPRQSHAHQGFSKSMSSTGADFRDLTPLVLMAALREAGTVVLEPIHRIRLELPTDVLPAVYPVLAAHRVLPGAPVVGETVTVIDGDVPAAEIHGLEQEIPGLTRGEGVLESRFDRYQAVVGRPPERSRTDRNPLDRAEYLLRATRGKGAMV
jgi:ribosomal protection tetracycline resistance protein